MLHPVRLARVAAISSAIVMTLGVNAASAEEAPGWYVGVLGGLNLMDTVDWELTGFGYEDKRASHYKTGFGGGALAGYDFGSLRLQGDLIYRRNKVGTETSGTTYDVSAFVATASATPMLSILYDIDTGTDFTPYVGAGIGASHVKFSYAGLAESAWSFAYQGVAGINYSITPHLLAAVEYRYLATPEFDYANFAGPGLDLVDFDTSNHSMFFGLVYKFGDAAPAPIPAAAAAAPPPPPAPPAPELARAYLVFFDWKASAVTSEAASIIGEAAKAAQQLAVTRVELTGHADRSGSTVYNQQLSEKRGAAVKNALVQLGVPANQIAVVGKGEASPLVPTADGVREPQNRRVEIVLP